MTDIGRRAFLKAGAAAGTAGLAGILSSNCSKATSSSQESLAPDGSKPDSIVQDGDITAKIWYAQKVNTRSGSPYILMKIERNGQNLMEISDGRSGKYDLMPNHEFSHLDDLNSPYGEMRYIKSGSVLKFQGKDEMFKEIGPGRAVLRSGQVVKHRTDAYILLRPQIEEKYSEANVLYKRFLQKAISTNQK